MRAILVVAVLCGGAGTLYAQPTETSGRLTLDDAVRIAQQHNPAIQIALEEVLASAARTGQARAAMNTKAGLEGRATAVENVPGLPGQLTALAKNENAAATISVRQLLYDGGRVSAAVAQAQHSMGAASHTLTRVRQSIAARTKTAYFTLAAATQNVETAMEAVRAADAHLETARKHYEARVVPQYDVLRAEVQVAEMRQQQIEAENARDLAQAGLADVLGAPGQKLDIAPVTPTEAVAVIPAQSLVAALANRPELRRSDEQMEASRAGRRNAEAGRQPVLSASVGYQAVAVDTALSRPGWTAGLLLTFEPFDGGLTKHRVAEAQARIRQVEAEAASLRNQIALEVEQACLRLTAASNRLKVAGMRVERAKEAFRISQLRYTSGVATAVEIADAQASLLAAETEQTRAAYDREAALAELELATGTWREAPLPGREGRR